MIPSHQNIIGLIFRFDGPDIVVRFQNHYAEFLSQMIIVGLRRIEPHNIRWIGTFAIDEWDDDCFEQCMKEKHLTDLKSLDCGGIDNITNYEDFMLLTELTRLDCEWCDGFNFQIIQVLTALKYLNIRRCDDIGDHSLIHLTSLETLICSEAVTDHAIGCLTQLRSLTTGHRVSDRSIYSLRLLRSLDCTFFPFESYSDQITDQSIERLTELTELNCEGCRGITMIVNVSHRSNYYPNLKKLNCSKSGVTGGSIERLTGLTSLNCLGCTVTDDQLKPLTGLVSLNCSATDVTDVSILCLTLLMTLVCEDCSTITDSSIVCLTQLSVLICDDCDSITTQSIQCLTRLQHLVHNKLIDRTITRRGSPLNIQICSDLEIESGSEMETYMPPPRFRSLRTESVRFRERLRSEFVTISGGPCGRTRSR